MIGERARVKTRVLHLIPVIFAANFRAKLLVWEVHLHFNRAARTERLRCDLFGTLSPSIFRINSHINCPLLVTCLCAFRLRTLTENTGPVLGFYHVCLPFFIRSFLRDVHVHVRCAGSLKTAVPLLGHAFFCKFSREVAFVKCSMCMFTAHDRTKRTVAQNAAPGLGCAKGVFFSRNTLVKCPAHLITQARTKWRSLHADLANAML